MHALYKSLGKQHSWIPAVLLCLLLIALSQTSFAQEWEWAPKFKVGDQFPPISAPDQNGKQRTLADLVGEKGVVLLLNRSFDWCPYCINQLKNLNEVAAQFEQLGFGIATMTYDPVSTLKEVEIDHGTGFPLLQDVDTQHFGALDILNKSYQPGDRAYGIPEPGIFILDPNGTILLKFAEESYQIRPDFADVLNAAAAI
ncbi:MAG: peroxiredoxin family protein [Pseudomonadales bacterium]|nr:peroxiredoxin family protein [Pseudomonadales bacterium]